MENKLTKRVEANFLVSDITDFKTAKVKKHKEWYFIVIKE